MIKLKILSLGFAVVFYALPANSQEKFPNRPVTVVVPFSAGGTTDVSMRLVGQKASGTLGQSVIVENKGGAAGQTGAVSVKRSPADGYTLFLSNIGTHAINEAIYRQLAYDPQGDFEPITLLWQYPTALLVPANSPFYSIEDIFRLGKSQPGAVTYASQGVGSGGHLLGALLQGRGKIDATHVPYRGVADALNDLVGGRVSFLFASLTGVPELIADGKLRALAMAGNRRSPLLPDVKTTGELGYPEIALINWFGLSAPSGTPSEIIKIINRAMTGAAHSPDVKERLESFGSEIVASSPEEYARVIKEDTIRLKEVATSINLRIE